MSLDSLILPLTLGARVYLTPPNVIGGYELVQFLQENQITYIVLTPSALLSFPETAPATLTSIRRVLTAGEAMTMSIAKAWGTGGKRKLINAYGPTEITVYCSISFFSIIGDPCQTHITHIYTYACALCRVSRNLIMSTQLSFC